MKEITVAVRMLRRYNVAGHNNITTEMLQYMRENKLFNKIWEVENIPIGWEVWIVISIFKKGNNSNYSNYHIPYRIECCFESVRNNCGKEIERNIK